MSVKHERNPRLNSSVRDIRDNIPSFQPNNNQDCLNCVANKIQFHKKLISACSLHLVCTSARPYFQPSELHSSQSQHEQSDYSFEIEGLNLHVMKCQVKHTFSLQRQMEERAEYLRIEFPEQQKISIQSCTISTNKMGIRTLRISDENRIKNYGSVTVINPVELIEENMKLRVTKLNKSAAKTINYNCQSVKKLNLNWNNEAPKDHREESPTFTKWRPKRATQNSSLCSSMSNFEIKGVPLKKSVEKYEPLPSRSVSKIEKDLSLKSINSANILQRSIHRKNMPDSKSNKNINVSSYAKQKGLRDKNGSIADQISSQSYYTAKKKLENSFDIQIETKKSSQTTSKENIVQSNSSFGPKAYPKLGYTEYRNHHRQSEANITASSNIDPKKFRKNISQIKIAQISRTLLPNHAKN